MSAAFTWLYRRSCWHWEKRRALIAPRHHPAVHLSSPPTQTWRILYLWSHFLAQPPALNKIFSCLRLVCSSKQQQLYCVRLRSGCSHPRQSYTVCKALKFSSLIVSECLSVHPFPVQSNSARAMNPVSQDPKTHSECYVISEDFDLELYKEDQKKTPHICQSVSVSVLTLCTATRKADRTEEVNWHEMNFEDTLKEKACEFRQEDTFRWTVVKLSNGDEKKNR